MNNNIIEVGRQCLKDEATAILELVPRLDSNFEKAVDIIYGCKGKCVVTGVGKSGHIGRKIAATLASTGTPAFFMNPLDAYHGDLGMVTTDDVVVAISYSGNTDELVRFLPILKTKNVPIVGMSCSDESLLGKASDAHLNIAVEREADPLNLAPTSSTTATLAMGDAIACALIERRQFKPTDFAVIHPGGDLGKKLLGKVSDIMFKEHLPIVSPAAAMQSVLETITTGTLGVAVVVEKDQLVGIITDGDVRRAMQRLGSEFFSTPARHIMSSNPKTIRSDARIVEAGEKMNNNSIHTLIVLDTNSKVCGIIDSFSCLPGTRFYH